MKLDDVASSLIRPLSETGSVLSNYIAYRQVDYLVATAIEHCFEGPEVEPDRLIEFNRRRHGKLCPVDNFVGSGAVDFSFTTRILLLSHSKSV